MRFCRLLCVAAAVGIGMDNILVKNVRAQDDADVLLHEAVNLARQGKSRDAVKKLDRVIALRPDTSEAYYHRGRENFRLGRIEASVADFEKFVSLAPEREKSLWELGISYYYAGRLERGARQFELYQTYHDSDVENAVWRYLCMAPSAGIEAARDKLLPIADDPRTPLMEIYALYRGQGTPDDVFAAARRGSPTAAALKSRLFYAHLYVGLFHEAVGNRDESKPHLQKAAEEFRIDHYMGDVARVHFEKMKEPAKGADQRKPCDS
jgi:lipoprotein NlpI